LEEIELFVFLKLKLGAFVIKEEIWTYLQLNKNKKDLFAKSIKLVKNIKYESNVK